MHEVVPGATCTGEVLLDGNNIYAPDIDPVQVRRRIGMVFQKPTPFPDDVDRRQRRGGAETKRDFGLAAPIAIGWWKRACGRRLCGKKSRII